jgi:hypothetical protein
MLDTGRFAGPSPLAWWGASYSWDDRDGPIISRLWRGAHALRWNTVVLPFDIYSSEYMLGQAARREAEYLWGNGSHGMWGCDDEWSQYMIAGMSAAA